MEISEIISEILVNPENGFSGLLSYRKPILFSFIIVCVSLFCQNIAGILTNNYGIFQTPGFIMFGYIFKLFSFIFYWILISSLFNFIAYWQKKEGSIINLFVLLGASLIPLIFLPAVSIINIFLGDKGNFIYILLYLIVISWIFYLQIKSLKMVYSIETGKAVFIYTMPFIATFILFIILIAAFAGFFVWFITSNLNFNY